VKNFSLTEFTKFYTIIEIIYGTNFGPTSHAI
jgi:hypothetical protein